MGFTPDTARKAAEAKKLAKALDTVEAQVARDKVALVRLKNDEQRTRYYISSPLARASEDVRASAMKLVLQVHPGPTKYQDDNGKQIQRTGGEVILLEGEGVTTDKLWAEYLQQEWPELEITEIPSSGLANYRQEIEEAKEALANG